MPTTTMPKSAVRCACGATALRCTVAKLGWEQHLCPPYDRQGRRLSVWLCPKCQGPDAGCRMPDAGGRP